MLVIRSVDPTQAIPVFWGTAGVLTPEQWATFCEQLGFIAFVAEKNGELVGYAVAESQPQVVHILNLEGDTGTCRGLLDRLVRLAGERDMSGWVPVARTDLLEMLEGLGFAQKLKEEFQGRPSYLCCWERDENKQDV